MATEALSPSQRPAAAAAQPVDPDRPTNKVIPIVLIVLLLIGLVAGVLAVNTYIDLRAQAGSENEELIRINRRFTETVTPFGNIRTASLRYFTYGLLFVGLPVLLIGSAIRAFLQLRRGVMISWLVQFGLVVGILGVIYVLYSGIFILVAHTTELSDKYAPLFWIPLLVIYGVIAAGYALWLYMKDAGQVGVLWAIFLLLLRLSVFAVLVWVFRLPALQAWDKNEQYSRVLILIDLSDSMRLSDDLPVEGNTKPGETRMDQVIKLLTKDDGAFIKQMQAQNPVFVYGFGGRLDDEFKEFKKKDGDTDPARWNADEWNAWARQDLHAWALEGLSDEGKKIVNEDPGFKTEKADKPEDQAQWALNWFKGSAVGEKLSGDDKAVFEKKKENVQKKLELRYQVASSTNYADALLSLVTRESNNMVSGIVVIGDGRSNQGSASTLTKALDDANKSKIPLFTIPVGVVREQMHIRITDLQSPEMAPPDEKWKVRIEIDGENLDKKEFQSFLDLFKPGQNPDTDAPVLTLLNKGTFKVAPGGSIPHATVEHVIDPEAKEFAKLVKKDEKEGGKPAFEVGEWKLRARVPRAPGEAFPHKEHVSDMPASIHLQKKPLRVLLFSGGAGKEYQFCRRLLINEMDKKRAEVSVCQQFGDPKGDRVLDVPPERLLKMFPNVLEYKKGTDKAEDRFYNLAQYDLVIAFDPDWTQVDPASLKKLESWVDAGGGLIVLAGPINTYQLARGANAERLKPIIDLFPVKVEDSRLAGLGTERTTNKPFALNFPGANLETEFLKLEDTAKDPKDAVVAGWSEFFYGKPRAQVTPQDVPIRGFFTFYPVKSVKQGARVIATFGDPTATMRTEDGKEQPMPFLVTMTSKKGRVVYLGWEGLWRLRLFKEEYHERFWTKLARYAGSGNLTRQSSRGVLIMGRQFKVGDKVQFEAELKEGSNNPLPATAEPRAKITAPTGVKMKSEYLMEPKKEGQWFGYFHGQFVVMNPGKYQLELPIPGSDELLRSEFYVNPSNPEIDNSKPDFAQMEQIASEVNKLRVNDAVKNALRAKLRAVPKPEGADKGTGGHDDKSAEPHLLFSLGNANLIPEYLAPDFKIQRNRGKIEDLWSDGFLMNVTRGMDWVWWGTALMSVILAWFSFAAILRFFFGPNTTLAIWIVWAIDTVIWLGVLVPIWVYGGSILPVNLLAPASLGLGALALILILVRESVRELLWPVLIPLVSVFVLYIGWWVLFANREPLADWSQIVSIVLVVVVSLLSIEWLTRKLLRLA